jgi:DNA polymerase-3 subunit delta'
MLDLQQLPAISSALPWHAQEWAQIDAQLREGLLPHALILIGQQYTGKSHFALALARRLLCNQPSGMLNCGRCHACELSASGNHGDFLWVEPEEKSRVIKIDQIRALVRFSHKTAAYGLRKVIVINPAGNMNLNAFNALLKSLEEPANDTYFILVCHFMDGIPNTIRSRCRVLRLSHPEYESCLAWLNSYTQKKEESQALLELADNLPLLAQQIYLTSAAEAITQRTATLNALLTGRINSAEAGALWGNFDIGNLLEHLGSDLQKRISNLEASQLQTRSGRATFLLFDEIKKLRRAISAGANPNKQLLIDSVLSKYGRYFAEPVNDTIFTQRREESV